MKKILFILKKRQSGGSGTWNYSKDGEALDSGLLVSARQVVSMLEKENVDVQLVQVIDNNCIDKEVAKHKPTHVIIEAFWVVPEKFDVLKKLHPTVKWIVRNHSKVDFLSHEGTIFGWVLDYISKGVYVACNSIEATDDFRELARILNLDSTKIVYLPNYYNINNNDCCKSLNDIIKAWVRKSTVVEEDYLNIGCFGAIRPLKNHMPQALAAINLAEYLNLKLKFHISATRIEGKAEPILNALRALFERMGIGYQLVEVPWLKHSDFVQYLSKMDMVFQVSLSETFNIVAADSTDMNVPVVGTSQIPWLNSKYVVKIPTEVQDITGTAIDIYNANKGRVMVADQLSRLIKYTEKSKDIWLDTLNESFL